MKEDRIDRDTIHVCWYFIKGGGEKSISFMTMTTVMTEAHVNVSNLLMGTLAHRMRFLAHAQEHLVNQIVSSPDVVLMLELRRRGRVCALNRQVIFSMQKDDNQLIRDDHNRGNV
ncbi:unnamed protein product [Albugo candida]|uniref:Uncharacterized protein n=1 Tax=Albugo candida TaxID=65357 RepID=A0A024G4U3_9STRA|nr:unnamed protein product [Albugo candida]|eukprot:CCI41573.1 unnamed protein product [Albugo candida]